VQPCTVRFCEETLSHRLSGPGALRRCRLVLLVKPLGSRSWFGHGPTRSLFASALASRERPPTRKHPQPLVIGLDKASLAPRVRTELPDPSKSPQVFNSPVMLGPEPNKSLWLKAVSRPTAFKGSPTQVNSFLYETESWLELLEAPPEKWVRLACQHLSDDADKPDERGAKTWFMLDHERYVAMNWVQFKTELKAEFLPPDAKEHAVRTKVRPHLAKIFVKVA
jgi:hypothetical protein